MTKHQDYQTTAEAIKQDIYDRYPDAWHLVVNIEGKTKTITISFSNLVDVSGNDLCEVASKYFDYVVHNNTSSVKVVEYPHFTTIMHFCHRSDVVGNGIFYCRENTFLERLYRNNNKMGVYGCVLPEEGNVITTPSLIYCDGLNYEGLKELSRDGDGIAVSNGDGIMDFVLSNNVEWGIGKIGIVFHNQADVLKWEMSQ